MSIPIIRQQNVIQDSTQSTILFILQVVRLRVFFLWCILEHVIISGAIIHSKSHKDSMSCQLAINSFTMQLMMSKFSVQDFYYIANAIQNSHVWSCTHNNLGFFPADFLVHTFWSSKLFSKLFIITLIYVFPGSFLNIIIIPVLRPHNYQYLGIP